jgi:hypothetical protein
MRTQIAVVPRLVRDSLPGIGLTRALRGNVVAISDELNPRQLLT